MTETTDTVIINRRCRAFSSEGVRMNRLRVEGETVYAWDSVANAWTLRHALGDAALRKAVRDAEALRAGDFSESHSCHFA